MTPVDTPLSIKFYRDSHLLCVKRSLSRAGQLGALGAAVIPVAVQNEQYQSWSAEEIQTAKRTAYVGFLHREPFVIDAFRLGFVVGIREDYTFQSSLRNVGVPVEIRDNDFRNPDLGRYIYQFERYEPEVGILGDAYSREEARRYTKAARKLMDKFDDVETGIVPKCPEAIEAIDDDIVFGYPWATLTPSPRTNQSPTEDFNRVEYP